MLIFAVIFIFIFIFIAFFIAFFIAIFIVIFIAICLILIPILHLLYTLRSPLSIQLQTQLVLAGLRNTIALDRAPHSPSAAAYAGRIMSLWYTNLSPRATQNCLDSHSHGMTLYRFCVQE
ncbi:hypothetical protein V8C37DRAFT_372191 [Trichoderma ceciliae]